MAPPLLSTAERNALGQNMPYHDNKISQYKISGVLGKGVTAVVLAATHRDTKEKVALKFINGDFYKEHSHFVQREVRAHAQFDHPNILKMKDVFMHKGSPVIVLERAKESLENILKTRKRLKPSRTKAIIRQTLSAVKFIHHKGWIHRDVKLENILIGYDGQVKLADFGFAMEIGDKTTCLSGSPEYMPPECFKGSSYDERFDIWSVGILVHVLLCGRIPNRLTDPDTLLLLRKEMLRIKKEGGFNWERIDDLHSEDVNFMNFVLNVDPRKRPSADLCLESEWFRGACSTIPIQKKWHKFLTTIKKAKA